MSSTPYTNEELARLQHGDAPDRGAFCPKCGKYIPTFAALTAADEARLRSLDVVSAIRELRGKTGCSLFFAKIWALHPDGPEQKKERPPCPYCGRPLFTTKSKQCVHCGWDWHDPKNPRQLKKEPKQALAPTPTAVTGMALR
jgi:ribosomal protein L37E